MINSLNKKSHPGVSRLIIQSQELLIILLCLSLRAGREQSWQKFSSVAFQLQSLIRMYAAMLALS